jgi:hypothetical protein
MGTLVLFHAHPDDEAIARAVARSVDAERAQRLAQRLPGFADASASPAHTDMDPDSASSSTLVAM